MGGSGGTENEVGRGGQVLPLQYAAGVTPSGVGRFWKWVFLVAGGYGLACVPAVFVFEQYRWEEGPVHASALAACVVCVASAGMYLKARRAAGVVDGTGAERRTRVLAYVALAVPVGLFVLFAALVVAMMMLRGAGEF